MLLNNQVNGHIYIYDFLADLLFFQHIQVNRLDFNAWKCWQTCHYIELSEYKLYMGHIHTLVLTREWIAMLCWTLIEQKAKSSELNIQLIKNKPMIWGSISMLVRLL